MVVVDQAPSLKVYDFKDETVLCDIPLGTLDNLYLSPLGTHETFFYQGQNQNMNIMAYYILQHTKIKFFYRPQVALYLCST